MNELGVVVERFGRVAVVTFSSGPHNYFDVRLIRELAEAFEALDRDSSTWATVLASTGRVFCAGASFTGEEDSSSDPGALYREALRLFALSKPVVAAVQGPAIGGGLGLALTADFRVAAPEARFAANFVKIGIHPGFGLTHTLPDLVGARPARRLLYSGDRIAGEEALAIGLIDELAPSDSVRDQAIALAAKLAEGAPLAVQATRRTLRTGLVEAVSKAMAHEQTEQSRLFDTADFKEGVTAVAERRLGQWTGA